MKTGIFFRFLHANFSLWMRGDFGVFKQQRGNILAESMRKNQRKIFKIHSKMLRDNGWKITLDREQLSREHPEYIISVGENQLIRFIDEVRGTEDAPSRIKAAYSKIRRLRKANAKRREIDAAYQELHKVDFLQDLIEIVIDSAKDYKQINQGFEVNDIHYRRLLGTNGGIKNRAIFYVNDELYPELKRRMDNGRDKEKKLVPAKLEAYQALICSGSTPLPAPKGFIVVKDCITHFKDDIILISNSGAEEPELTYVDGYEVEHNDSDGYGLMSPEYARRVNAFFTGDSQHEITGMNTRYSWCKGMVYTFDFQEFARDVAGTDEVIDAWGDKRNINDADVILTTSMLKLWDSYTSWEDYFENCERNHYRFSAVKVIKPKQKNVRTSNYQFLQNYDFSDAEIKELCAPTIEEVKNILGLDPRITLLYLAGSGLTDNNIDSLELDYFAQALMYEPKMVDDPYLRNKIWQMLQAQIKRAERGKIYLDGDYLNISGDPYALCQSMFNLEITGLLKAGEIYSRYWADKEAAEVVCFRAPMCVSNNIRKMRVADDEQISHWYQYINNAVIFNAFDTACEAMSGCDKDGDTSFITDNRIILNATNPERPIICKQGVADKIKNPTEKQIVEANQKAFNSSIGLITNIATAICELQAGYEPNSEEYNILAYRKMCCQQYQQDEIDKTKGIKTNDMPDYWHKPNAATTELDTSLVADRKPYFFRYVYDCIDRNIKVLQESYANHIRCNTGMEGGNDAGIIAAAQLLKDKTPYLVDILDRYREALPVVDNGSVMNRLCHHLEREFAELRPEPDYPPFDYKIMCSGESFSDSERKKIEGLYKDYRKQRKLVENSSVYNDPYDDREDDGGRASRISVLNEWFIEEAHRMIPNSEKLTNIVLDILYKEPEEKTKAKSFRKQSKAFAWIVCGDQIIDNLRKRAGGILKYPAMVDDDGEFSFRGCQFVMQSKKRIEAYSDYENQDFE